MLTIKTLRSSQKQLKRPSQHTKFPKNHLMKDTKSKNLKKSKKKSQRKRSPKKISPKRMTFLLIIQIVLRIL